MDEDRPVNRFAVPDRFMGGLLILAFSVDSYGYLRVQQYAMSVADRPYPSAFWVYAGILLGFLVRAFYSTGVLLGKRWAFGLTALASAHRLVTTIEQISMYSGYRTSSVEDLALNFVSVLGFLYCGLRFWGSVQAKVPKILPERNAGLYED